MYWDLKTNFDISSGFSHCHSALDLELTANGDLSIISGIDEIKQRFLLYLGIPKGERYDKNIGSSALDYLHEKNTNNNMRRLEQDIMGDMKYQFPDLPTKSVACLQGLTDPFLMELTVKLANEEMMFMYSPQELLALTSQIDSLSVS